MLLRPRLLAAAVLLLALAACGDDALPPPLEVYEDGRGVVVEPADSAGALLVEHEPFDSTMTQPMVMALRLADPREGEDLRPGDKIQFDLVLDRDYRIENVEKLPPSTRLILTDSSATTTPDATPDTSGGV